MKHIFRTQLVFRLFPATAVMAARGLAGEALTAFSDVLIVIKEDWYGVISEIHLVRRNLAG